MKVELADTSRAAYSGKHLTTQVTVTGKGSITFANEGEVVERVTEVLRSEGKC